MQEELSRCGYRCDLCAARSDDPEVRRKLVEKWKKYYGHDMYTVENVRCDGCLHDGRLADKSCQARPCAIERELPTCAHCDDFACDKVKHLIGGTKEESFRRFENLTEEDYNLCMRMFASRERLRAIRKAIGKPWPKYLP
jgi:hypothetical protein